MGNLSFVGSAKGCDPEVVVVVVPVLGRIATGSTTKFAVGVGCRSLLAGTGATMGLVEFLGIVGAMANVCPNVEPPSKGVAISAECCAIRRTRRRLSTPVGSTLFRTDLGFTLLGSIISLLGKVFCLKGLLAKLLQNWLAKILTTESQRHLYI